MAEEKANPDEGTGEQEKQTVTAEQFEELQRQLEETRKAQSGSDRTVAELRKKLEEKEREAESAGKSAEEKAAERIAEIEKKLADAERDRLKATQESLAVRLLSDAGVTKTPKIFSRLVGESEDETKALIQEYLEDIQELRAAGTLEEAKKNGMKPRDSNVTIQDGKSIHDYTDAELKAMPDDVFEKLFERAKMKG